MKKNLASKVQQLETKHFGQQELLYHAEFQVQQIERKVARGLGERSDKEKKQLQEHIVALQSDQNAYEVKKKHLTQQSKVLYQELQTWGRSRVQWVKSQKDTEEMIAEVELEISSCELNRKQLISSKDENMVSHDIVRLEVRRLRDILRNKARDVYLLEEHREEIIQNMKARKEEIDIQTEVKTAQLRAAEEERHKRALELGKRTIVADKIKLKYEMLTKAHHTDENETGENQSHVYHLIMAAQKRADLQREGDQLDVDIRQKDKEMKAMKKMVQHLRQRNTDFRQSFSKLDLNDKTIKELLLLEERLTKSEKLLFEAKKQYTVLQRDCDKDGKLLASIHHQTSELSSEMKNLASSKKRIEDENTKNRDNNEGSDKLVQKERYAHISPNCTRFSLFYIIIILHSFLTLFLKRVIHRNRDYPTLFLRENSSLQEVLFCAELIEDSSKYLICMLMEIGREFYDLQNSIISGLTREGLEFD